MRGAFAAITDGGRFGSAHTAPTAPDVAGAGDALPDGLAEALADGDGFAASGIGGGGGTAGGTGAGDGTGAEVGGGGAGVAVGCGLGALCAKATPAGTLHASSAANAMAPNLCMKRHRHDGDSLAWNAATRLRFE